jgi:Recombination endonuclease VII
VTDLTWTPPEGMAPTVARSWRTFYRHILETYGVTPEFYRALYLAQLGRCFVCRTAKGKHPDDPRGGGGRRLGVDHSHAHGYGRPEAVRGLLCTGGDRTCNRIVGWLKDDPAAFDRAAQLVREMPAQGVLLALRDGQEPDALKGMLTDV